MKKQITSTNDLTFDARPLRASDMDTDRGGLLDEAWNIRRGEYSTDLDSRSAHHSVDLILKRPTAADSEFDAVLVYLLNLGIPINIGTLHTYATTRMKTNPHLAWYDMKNQLVWARNAEEPAEVIEQPRAFCHRVIGQYYYKIFFPMKNEDTNGSS